MRRASQRASRQQACHQPRSACVDSHIRHSPSGHRSVMTGRRVDVSTALCLVRCMARTTVVPSTALPESRSMTNTLHASGITARSPRTRSDSPVLTVRRKMSGQKTNRCVIHGHGRDIHRHFVRKRRATCARRFE
jgi:hypothetical protein